MNNFSFDIGPGYTAPVDVYASAFPEEAWFFDAVGGRASDSGERVNARTALTHGIVWQAVNVLAGDVGQLPWHKMIRTEDFRGSKVDRDHPLEWLVSWQPNQWQTPSEWLEMMQAIAVLHGNGISLINRNQQGERELIPLDPLVTTYELDDMVGYIVITRIGGKQREFLPQQVFHVKGLATNGCWGIGIVDIAKNVIGHGLALQKHGNRVFKNSSRPSGVLQHPGKLSPEARANLRREWEQLHAGSDNAGRVAILMEEMTFNPYAISNEDAQWIDARRFDREMIASIANIPPYRLGAMENSAVRSNIEQQNRDYLNTTLARLLNKFNQQASAKLLSMRERRTKRHFFAFDTENFLRGDLKTLMESISIGVTSRVLSPNEGREKLGLSPREGGDEYANPAIDTSGNQEADPPQEDNGDAAAQLLRKQVAALCENEACTVRKSCTSARNLCKWAANYYEKYAEMAANYLELPAELAGAKGWRKAAENHATDSLNRLLGAAGVSTKADLPEVGKELAEAIRATADAFAAEILGERNG